VNAGYDVSGVGKPLSDTAITKITDTENGIAGLGTLKDKMMEASEYIGPIAGFQALYPWSKANIIRAEVDKVRQTVGKALEGGVLRKEDEIKYKAILPTVNDTLPIALAKIASLETSLTDSVSRYKQEQALAGRSVRETTGDKYVDERSQLKSGEILVKDKKTGGVGAIPNSEFNSSTYTKL